MLDDLLKDCTVGCKKNLKISTLTWTGYKLHMDMANGEGPVSCIDSSALKHDSQVAIPLVTMTRQRVTNCYNLMGSRYDAKEIRARGAELKHVPFTDTKQRNRIADYGQEQQARYNAGFTLPERGRYQEHLTAECAFGRL